MPRPNKLHDELDALLDGRPVELTDDLTPLVEAADLLRAELSTYELDPEVAGRHLEQVLHGTATVVPLPLRPQPSGWEVRRRVVAVALAAALVLAPATMASAAALPGQAMYPFKLAIEQLRLASVQWSPTREAGERTRLADERLGELESVVELQMFGRIPPAVTAFDRALTAAELAVEDAVKREGPGNSQLVALAVRLEAVKAVSNDELGKLGQMVPTMVVSDKTREAIARAVATAQATTRPPLVVTGTTAATPATVASNPSGSTSGGSNTSGSQPGPTTTAPPASTTTRPEQSTTTTEVPTTTTTPPTSTPDATTAGSEGTSATVEQQPGGDERAGDEPPPSSIAGS